VVLLCASFSLFGVGKFVVFWKKISTVGLFLNARKKDGVKIGYVDRN
jgi:hypothetical protein